MIGEMWVNLEEVIIAGGGKSDAWHTLSYKGKYAGEVMLELTYYDSRPDERGDRLREISAQKKIKRRPLPTDNVHTTPLPHQMDNTRTAGPRAMGSRTRAPSSAASGSVAMHSHSRSHSHSAAPPVQYPHHHASPEDPEYHPGFQPQYSGMPDLPELPPTRAHRGSMPSLPRNTGLLGASHSGPLQHHPELPHSHSEPVTIPQIRDIYDHPQQLVPRGRRYDEPPGWDGPHMALQPTVEDEGEDLPPLPPSHHRNSAARQAQFVTSQSLPLKIERQQANYHQSPRGPPARSRSGDDYASPNYSSPVDFRNSYSGPSSHLNHAPSSAVSSPSYPRPASSHRVSARQSFSNGDSYNTPPRAHPLAQELHRSASPAPSRFTGSAFDSPDHQQGSSIVRPHAISPAPSPVSRTSLASIRHPVQSFGLQGSTGRSNPDLPILPSIPARKSVSPRPVSSSGRASAAGSGLGLRPSTSSGGGGMGGSSGNVPFSPDDYNTFNPSFSPSPLTHSNSTNPHSPYHIPNSPQLRQGSEEPSPRPLPNPDGPITTWDGRTVDPSDHLPVHSWAPEPIKKTRTPEKQYGAGSVDPSRARGLSGPRRKDFVVSVRNKHVSAPGSVAGGYDAPSPVPVPQASGGRNRLIKARLGAPRSPNPNSPHGQSHGASSGHLPLAEIDVPNPYAQNNAYADGFGGEYNGTGYQRQSPGPGYQQQQQQQRHYGDIFGGEYENQYAPPAHPHHRHTSSLQYPGSEAPHGYGQGYGGRGYSEPPELPPKVEFDNHAYGASALERELQNIDIGGSRRPGSSAGMGTVRRGNAGGRGY